MGREIFLVEELENRLAREAVLYLVEGKELFQNNNLDPNYFRTLLTGKVYSEFISSIYDKLKPLNNHEANRFLTLSVIQFKTHTPDKRLKEFFAKYWDEKWSYSDSDDEVKFNDEKYVTHIWDNYIRQFPLYREATKNVLEDFKAGLLGPQPTQSNTQLAIPDPIRYEAFKHYLNQFKHDEPLSISALEFKYSMRNSLVYLKTEILDNLITLSKDDRRVYLNKLRNELENKNYYAFTSQETIDNWFATFNVASEEKSPSKEGENRLYTILTVGIPLSEVMATDDVYREARHIQTDFYNYYYGIFLNYALEFIVDQINQLNPLYTPIVEELSPPLLNENNLKLKTNLSVPQLALLFKMLNDLKPNIFEIKYEADLLRFISANFETKRSKEEGISTDKLRILFNQPDSKAADFWEKHFYTLIAEIKKIK